MGCFFFPRKDIPSPQKRGVAGARSFVHFPAWLSHAKSSLICKQFVRKSDDLARVLPFAGIQNPAIEKVIGGHHCNPHDADNDPERHERTDDLHCKTHSHSQHECPENAERVGKDRGGTADRSVQRFELFQPIGLLVYAKHTSRCQIAISVYFPYILLSKNHTVSINHLRHHRSIFGYSNMLLLYSSVLKITE